jgi:hypothetical protein
MVVAVLVVSREREPSLPVVTARRRKMKSKFFPWH